MFVDEVDTSFCRGDSEWGMEGEWKTWSGRMMERLVSGSAEMRMSVGE